MGRPPATPAQKQHRKRRRAWAHRTRTRAVRSLIQAHPGQYQRFLTEARTADPEPGKEAT